MPDPNHGRRGRRENRRRARRDCFLDPGLYTGHPVVHFDVPTAAGRQIFSIQCCPENEEAIVSPLRGSSSDDLAAARSESGPLIVVFVDREGKYFTDYDSPRIQELMLKVLSFLSRREEKHVGDTAPAQTMEQLDLPSLNNLLHTASLKESSTTSSSSSIWALVSHDWGITFYIRIDHTGFFHTYPCVGGPFRSLQEAYSAIDCYLRDREDPTMRIDPDDPDLIYHVLESTRERAIRRILCWPDGTRTSRLQSEPVDQRRCWMLQLVRALVGKYNDDHNLLGDLAYGLQGVVCYHVFNEGGNNRRMYYHVNFTANTKFSKDLLFFAETISEQRDELVVSCICRINPSDKDRGHCHACLSDVKHPKDDAYFGGHSSAGVLSGTYHSHGPKEDLGVTAAQLKDEESRVRYSHKGPRDPNFLEKLRAPVEVNFPPPRPIEDTIAFISRFCR
ncbi:uncharacterized protein [Lolium perenne]|uniref:uncharacterized protein isoform X1 n=2 Tax=Lolium perenne TaxID=4522 RepID=UPI0021F5EB27|nr:uncharacterized protein LOC127344899 isoform X1 [Lolium perenne]